MQMYEVTVNAKSLSGDHDHVELKFIVFAPQGVDPKSIVKKEENLPAIFNQVRVVGGVTYMSKPISQAVFYTGQTTMKKDDAQD